MVRLQVLARMINAKNNLFWDEKYEEKMNRQLRVVKATFTGSNITKYSELNIVAKIYEPP